MDGIVIKNLHVDQMRDVVSPIQHWSVDERLGILYEDLLNMHQISKLNMKLNQISKLNMKMNQISKLNMNPNKTTC